MDKESFYKVVSDVTATWEKVKKIPEYEEKVGSMLFRTIFEKDPKVWESFPFGQNNKAMKSILKNHLELAKNFPQAGDDMKTRALSINLLLKNDPKFALHAQKWVRMFSLAIHMLGPDLEVVEEEFTDLGERHKKYELTPKHYQVMGKALLLTIEELLGKEEFNEELKYSWRKFYSFISKTMLKGMDRRRGSGSSSSSERSLSFSEVERGISRRKSASYYEKKIMQRRMSQQKAARRASVAN